jgi:UDP-glucose 4,6-dehydratase
MNKDLSAYWAEFELALRPHPSSQISPPHRNLGAGDSSDERTISKSLTQQESTRAAIFLIYGKTGWIGGMLGRLLAGTEHSYFYGAARLHDRKAIEEDIARCQPTHILNAAGITGRPNVDWCESHKREVVQTNVLGTLNLIDVAQSQGIHVTNFATGCIYSYDEDHPIGGPGFTEEDVPNFRGSYYSNTKAMVEELIHQYDNVLQLRLRMPIDDDLLNPRNFIFKIANYEKVVNIPNSMTVLNELLPLAIDGALRKLTGIYNFTNPGVISHNEVLQLYKDYCDKDFTWSNFSLDQQSEILAAPRSNNRLDTKKLQEAFPCLLDIRDSLIKHVFEVNKERGSRIPKQ